MTAATKLALVLLLINVSVLAQNTPTLVQLKGLGNSKDYTDFDTKVRALGYSFETKEIETDFTRYTYTKRIETQNKIYTLYLKFSDYGDSKPVVAFSCPADLSPNFINSLRSQAIGAGFALDTDNCGSELSNVVTICLKSTTHIMNLMDIAVREEEKRYNVYSVIIFKRGQ